MLIMSCIKLQGHGGLLSACIGIMFNCAKRPENFHHISRVGLDDVLVTYFDAKDENLVLFCYVSAISLLPVSSIQKLSVKSSTIYKLVMFLKLAAADEKLNVGYSFAELGEGVRMHGFEIVMAIGALAHNEKAKDIMVRNDVLAFLVDYAEKETNIYNQELALTTILDILALDTVLAATKVSKLNALLRELAASKIESMSNKATYAIRLLIFYGSFLAIRSLLPNFIYRNDIGNEIKE